MKVKLEIINGNEDQATLKDVIEAALKKKNFNSNMEFAKLVAKKTGSSEHAEAAGVSRIMTGQSGRLEPDRAKVYAEILNIPVKQLLGFGGIGKYHKGKPIIVDDSIDITETIKKLAMRGTVTLEELVKEILYISHQQ